MHLVRQIWLVSPPLRGSETLNESDSGFPSPSVSIAHDLMPLRMLSPQSLSDETITDKLLSGHHGYEDHAGGDDLATPKYQAKWRCLAIVSSGLLAVSLLFNIFQYRTSLQKGAGGPYVYCTIRYFNLLRTSVLMTSSSTCSRCRGIRGKSISFKFWKRSNPIPRTAK